MKQRWRQYLVGVCLSMMSFAAVGQGLLRIEITGLTEASGSVFIAVYDSESAWLGDETVLTREVVIADALDGELVVVDLQLPVGRYAFSLFHDNNGNGELDTNFIGMPKEPIAMSNNARGKFGPPRFEDALFDLELEPQTQRLIIGTL